MPIPPDALRPSPRQILAAVPTRFRHTMLRLMPYGPHAPTEYKDLQALAFWAVAKRRSVEQRVEALEAICALYDHDLGEMPRRWRLIEEIAQKIWISDRGFRVAEILLLARLDEISACIEEEKAAGVVVGIPTIRGRTTVLTAESPELRAVQGLLSEAVVQMSSKSRAELARLPESERIAAIRLLRLYTVLGRHDVRLAEQSAARLRFFRSTGKGLWNALKKVPLLHAPQPEIYGDVAMNRIDHALSGEAGLEVNPKTVRPKVAAADAAHLSLHPTDLDTASPPAPGSSLMHVVVRGMAGVNYLGRPR